LITLISCGCYVATWEILYFKFGFMHEFMDKYGAYMVEQAKASGSSQESIQAQVRDFERYKQLYENPLFNAAMTFMEPFPVGLLVSIVSAVILRRRRLSGINHRDTETQGNPTPANVKN
jgi:hypothetical protein